MSELGYFEGVGVEAEICPTYHLSVEKQLLWQAAFTFKMGADNLPVCTEFEARMRSIEFSVDLMRINRAGHDLVNLYFAMLNEAGPQVVIGLSGH
jgi:hypothetical protein